MIGGRDDKRCSQHCKSDAGTLTGPGTGLQYLAFQRAGELGHRSIIAGHCDATHTGLAQRGYHSFKKRLAINLDQRLVQLALEAGKRIATRPGSRQY